MRTCTHRLEKHEILPALQHGRCFQSDWVLQWLNHRTGIYANDGELQGVWK